MAPARKELRARIQVPNTQALGTPENDSRPGSSISALPCLGDYSPLLAPSRQPPPPPPSRLPPQTPALQDRNLANPAPAINLGLTNAQKTGLFEIELEKSKHQIKQAAAAASQVEKP